MSAATTNPSASSRELFPVKNKPSESSETKEVFVDLVWRHLTPTSFKNIGEFEKWFQTLVPCIVSDFGEDKERGRTMIALAFPFGGVQHFLRWVIMKFTTTKKS